MRTSLMIGILLVTSITNPCEGQKPPPSPAPGAPSAGASSIAEAPAIADDRASDPNVVAIQAAAKAFAEAFDGADAAAVASLWTEDGEYVDAAGDTFTGRSAIEKSYEEYFSANQDAKLRINIDSIRILSETAAIEEGTTLVEVPPVAAAIGRYTAIHVKVDGQWQMASVRDTLVDATVAPQNVADLDWLVGTWIAEEHGNKYVSVNHWVGKQSFVQRDFTTTLFDGTQSSGVQLIGWNPQAGHVQSWTFNADGGHAIGVWMPSDDGWQAQMQGMTGDGVATVSINLLTRLDDNAYVWQSVSRTTGGVAVSDTDEIVIKRQPVTK